MPRRAKRFGSGTISSDAPTFGLCVHVLSFGPLECDFCAGFSSLFFSSVRRRRWNAGLVLEVAFDC